MGDNEVSQAAFAKIRGVSAPMVCRWKQAGRLAMSEDGTRVMVRESMELLDSSLDPARGGDRSVGDAPRSLPPPGAQQDAAAYARGNRGDRGGYQDAARSEKIERTAILKLERMEREGSLVLRSMVESEAQTRATQAREALISIPDRLCSQLAAESDANKVRAMLDAEIRHVIAKIAAQVSPQQQEAA